jgi:hypothetical protein
MQYCNLHSLAQNKRPLMKKEATTKCKGLKTKYLRQKKREPQNARGPKQKTFEEKEVTPKTQGAEIKRRPIKKEATPNRKGLKTKDLWRKKKQPHMQGDQNKRPLMRKEATPKHKGLKTKDLWWKKTSNVQGNQKSRTVSSPNASFAKLMLEGEDDVFWFHFECQAITNRTKEISQIKNKKPLAHWSQLR